MKLSNKSTKFLPIINSFCNNKNQTKSKTKSQTNFSQPPFRGFCSIEPPSEAVGPRFLNIEMLQEPGAE